MQRGRPTLPSVSTSLCIGDDTGDNDGTSEGYSCNPPKVTLTLHTEWLLRKSLKDGLSHSCDNRLITPFPVLTTARLALQENVPGFASLKRSFFMPRSRADFRSSFNVSLSFADSAAVVAHLLRPQRKTPRARHTNADQTSLSSVYIEQKPC